MKKALPQIAILQTGVFAKTVSEGNVVYLQAKHFDNAGKLISALHPDLKINDLTEKHLLQPGDVLFAAKGEKNFAAVYESKNLPAVASTTFFVIRLYEKNVLPEYVAWVLNNPTTKSFLKRNATGTSIVSISKTMLEDLEISVPDITVQKAILAIAQLRKSEMALKQQIEALREKQIQKQITHSLK